MPVWIGLYFILVVIALELIGSSLVDITSRDSAVCRDQLICFILVIEFRGALCWNELEFIPGYALIAQPYLLFCFFCPTGVQFFFGN